MLRARERIVVAGLLAVMAAAPGAQGAHRQTFITAKAAILIDNQTGEILWQRNPDLPLPPASTTKIVTAMLALQSGRLEDSLGVTAEAAQAPPSKISLRPGWRMRLRDLVYALLLNSANDASVVIAQGLAGSVHDFADRMNAEARSLGATNTHFVNPNGLPAANHYSTARDLATMFGHAMQNPMFEKIVSTKTATVAPTAGSLRTIYLRNHNRLLGNYRIQVVGKTGWTIAAKKCFAGAATSGGRELGVAVLGSRDLWGDLKRLLEYGFDGGVTPAPEGVELQAVAVPLNVPAGDDDSPTVPPRAGQKYFLSLATFHAQPSAARLRNSLTRAGYAAHVEQVRHGRKPLYRVLVGAYASREEAERVASRLGAKHGRPTLVLVDS